MSEVSNLGMLAASVDVGTSAVPSVLITINRLEMISRFLYFALPDTSAWLMMKVILNEKSFC